MKITRRHLRRLIKEELLREIDILAGDVEGTGGGSGPTGGKGTSQDPEYCCSKWYNLSKDYPDQVPSDWSGGGDYWVDRCWNPRGEPVYDGNGRFIYSCTAARGQGSLTGRLSDFASEAMNPASDVNLMMGFVDLTGVTQIPHIPIALDAYEENETVFNAVMLVLAVLAVIPFAGKLAKLGSATLRRLKAALDKIMPSPSVIPSTQLDKARDAVDSALPAPRPRSPRATTSARSEISSRMYARTITAHRAALEAAGLGDAGAIRLVLDDAIDRGWPHFARSHGGETQTAWRHYVDYLTNGRGSDWPRTPINDLLLDVREEMIGVLNAGESLPIDVDGFDAFGIHADNLDDLSNLYNPAWDDLYIDWIGSLRKNPPEGLPPGEKYELRYWQEGSAPKPPTPKVDDYEPWFDDPDHTGQLEWEMSN